MTAAHLNATLQAALNHHLAGRFAAAEPLYREVLQAAPNHPDANHLFGVLALQCGQPAAAVELISRAVSITPQAASLNNLGEAYRSLNRQEEAIDCYRKSLVMDPKQADAHANLGLVLMQQGKLADAEAAFRQAAAVTPNHLGAAFGMATLLDRTDRKDEAVSAWELVARLQPNRPDVHKSLGMARQRADDAYAAVSAFRRAIELDANYAEAYCKLAIALGETGKSEESIATARRAVELAPKAWQAHQDLGIVLERAGKLEEAATAYTAAVELHPTAAHLRGSLANALVRSGRLIDGEEQFKRGVELEPTDARFRWSLSKLHFRRHDYPKALEAADDAVRLAPHDPESHASRAFALLAMGNYKEGFKEYEWRWRSSSFTTKPRDFDRPLWDGSNPAGRTILVHSEQGFGDIFQFLRYLPLLTAKGANVIAEVPYKVAGLVRRMPGIGRVVVSGTILPDFDMHTPMLSLPAVFGTTLDSIPSAMPYLLPDPAQVIAWREKLGPADGLRVGLVWAGSPKPDPARTAKLVEFAALGSVPGISLIAMQPESNGAEANDPPAGMKLLNIGSQLRDFSETTASVLANLDLMITIDTSVAHLAGAMAIPTWILLPYSPDWRWMLDRPDTPWYPTVRLFRQSSPGDWAAVAEAVAGELGKG